MVLESIIGAVGGIASAGINAASSYHNYQMQQENLAWQKEKQTEAWAREDTAVQRRSRDLEESGLSKTLAAGSAATTMSPIKTTAPQIENLQPIKMALEAITQKKQIQRTAAETANIKAQTDKTNIESDFLRGYNPLRTEELSIQNKFNKLMNPKKLIEKDKQNRMMNMDWHIKNATLAIKEIGIDQATLALVRQQIARKIDLTNLSLKRQQLIIQQTAIRIANLQIQQKNWDITKLKEIGVPSTGLDKTTRWYSIFQEMFRRMIDLNQQQPWGQ